MFSKSASSLLGTRAAGLLPTMAGLPWAANRGRSLPATPPHIQGYMVWPQKRKAELYVGPGAARGIACQFISRRPPTPCLPGAPRYCFLAQENRARAPSQSSSRSSPRRGSQRGRSRFIEEVRRLKFWLSMQPRRKASRALLLLECRSFFPSFYLSSSNTRRLSHTRPRPTVAKMFSLPLDR